MDAMLLVPEEYGENADRKYPAIYVIPGFGGNDRQALGFLNMIGQTDVPFVKVGLDPTTPLGHGVFADSANNGPWGEALTTELIPFLESKFRLISESRGRFLTGHSSGGWSSLWLQVTYPDFFGGTWSGSPDSVTFRDFCGINLYEPGVNFYRDANGNRRPIWRREGGVRLYLEDFARLEDVIGPGGQVHAFEAVFGPRGPDGRPKLVFDRQSGNVDPAVIEAWKRYDIVKILEDHWTTLGPKLSGKITVIMGGADDFYLDGAARILKQTLERLGSDARVFIEPGLDHGSIMGSEPYRNVLREMSEKFEASQPRTATTQPVPTG
jgi:S-formylglutathione hydrolase FrmB